MYFTSQEIENVLNKVLELFLIPRFRELGMNATGEWLENLEVVAEAEKSIGKIRGRQYSEQLAKGREPNSNQNKDAKRRWAYGMANHNPEFKKWLQARGLQDYGIQIAYKIAEQGTSWYQKGGTDLLEVFEEPRTIQFIQDELSAIARVKVTEQLRRNAEILV